MVRICFTAITVCFVLLFAFSVEVIGEMGPYIPTIGENEGLLKTGRAPAYARIVTSRGTLGEMGAWLPVIRENEGILKVRDCSKKRIHTSMGTMGEMGVRLPVLKEGDGLLKKRYHMRLRK